MATHKRRAAVAHECMICYTPFTVKLKIKERLPIRHCKKCAKSVCDNCSGTRRQLSKEDTEKYRVCDECDFELDNIVQLTKSLKQVSTAKDSKILMLNSRIMEMHDNTEMLV